MAIHITPGAMAGPKTRFRCSARLNARSAKKCTLTKRRTTQLQGKRQSWIIMRRIIAFLILRDILARKRTHIFMSDEV